MSTDTAEFHRKLVGTWQCLSYALHSATDPDDIMYPWGQVSGSLMYSSDGYMSALITKGNLPRHTPDVFSGTPEQRELTGGGVTAYYGRVVLGERVGEEQVIRHHVENSVPANWIGEIQTRYCTMSEDKDGRLRISMRPAQLFSADGKTPEKIAKVLFAKKTNLIP